MGEKRRLQYPIRNLGYTYSQSIHTIVYCPQFNYQLTDPVYMTVLEASQGIRHSYLS